MVLRRAGSSDNDFRVTVQKVVAQVASAGFLFFENKLRISGCAFCARYVPMPIPLQEIEVWSRRKSNILRMLIATKKERFRQERKSRAGWFVGQSASLSISLCVCLSFWRLLVGLLDARAGGRAAARSVGRSRKLPERANDPLFYLEDFDTIFLWVRRTATYRRLYRNKTPKPSYSETPLSADSLKRWLFSQRCD